MSPETRKTIDIPHPYPMRDCPTCSGSGIEEMRVADADKVDITCRECLKSDLEAIASEPANDAAQAIDMVRRDISQL